MVESYKVDIPYQQIKSIKDLRQVLNPDSLCSILQDISQDQKMDFKTELRKTVGPLLKDVLEQVSKLTVDEIKTLQRQTQPSKIAIMVMKMLCHMFNYNPVKYDNMWIPNDDEGYFYCARELLSQPKILIHKMRIYQKRYGLDSAIRDVKRILNDPSFSLEALKGESNAIQVIYKWVDVVMQYHELHKQVRPQEHQLKYDPKILPRVIGFYKYLKNTQNYKFVDFCFDFLLDEENQQFQDKLNVYIKSKHIKKFKKEYIKPISYRIENLYQHWLILAIRAGRYHEVKQIMPLGDIDFK